MNCLISPLLSTLFILFIGLNVPSTFAQQVGPAYEISTWFQEERFLITDRNEDAYLDRRELEAFPDEFIYYLTERNFDLTDRNRDGRLSFNEIHARRNDENVYRYHVERRKIRQLAEQFPLLAQADIRYLRQYPGLVAQLFSNLIWLYEHPDMAARLYLDKGWCAANPEVLISLHRNLRWMAANPSTAARLYQNQSAIRYVPELMSWRADHKAFIRRHPKWKAFYSEGFIPGGVRNY